MSSLLLEVTKMDSLVKIKKKLNWSGIST